MSKFVIILDSDKDNPSDHICRRESDNSTSLANNPTYNPAYSVTYSKGVWTKQFVKKQNVTSMQTGDVASAAIYSLNKHLAI